MRPDQVIEARLAEAADQFCMGQISAVVGNKVTVTTTAGGSVTIPRLSTWTPANDDVVLIAKTPAGWVAIGKVA